MNTPGLGSITLAAAWLLAAACGPAPQQSDGPAEVAEAEVVPPTSPTLKSIMQALESDMAAVAHGIWLEDNETVRVAAARIADHPRVPPEQLAAIQATLGPELATFAGLDQEVHGASVALVESAPDATMAELLAGYQRVQNGCVACHTAFRPRVSEALNPAG